MFSAPRAWLQSIAHLSRSTAALRTFASGLIGFASGVTIVTVVHFRPRLSSSLRTVL